MTTLAQGLRSGRSHLIIAAVLAIGGTLVVRTEDRALNREAGKAIPRHDAVLPAAPLAIALPSATPAPAGQPQIAPVPAPSATSQATARPTAASGPAIQLGAFDTAAVAEERWHDIAARVPSLAALDHRIESAQTDQGTVHRLIVAAPDRASARAACRAVRGGGGNCFVR